MIDKKTFDAVATLTGTIIGAGFFSLPYVASQTGLPLMLGFFAFTGGLVLVIHLVFSQVALETPDFARLPGFARQHLGRWGETLAMVSSAVGTYGSLLAYLVLGGVFLTNLVGPFWGGGPGFYGLLYFGLAAIFVYFGIRPIAKIDLADIVALSVILVVILFFGRPFFRVENLLVQTTDGPGRFFLAYGPLLFSLWGATMIPEIEEMLGEQKKKTLKKVVLVSWLISLLFYLAFTVLILGITGRQTTPDAFGGLAGFLGQGIASLGLILGLITVFTSFIALGLTLEKIYRYDLKMAKLPAFGLVAVVPLVLFLLGGRDFVKIISFIGGGLLGIEGTLILLMYRKLHPQKRWIYPLILVFLSGLAYETFRLLK